MDRLKLAAFFAYAGTAAFMVITVFLLTAVPIVIILGYGFYGLLEGR